MVELCILALELKKLEWNLKELNLTSRLREVLNCPKQRVNPLDSSQTMLLSLMSPLGRTGPFLHQRFLFFIFPPSNNLIFSCAEHWYPHENKLLFWSCFKIWNMRHRVTPLPLISICILHAAHYQPLLAVFGKQSDPVGIQSLWNKLTVKKKKAFTFMFLMGKKWLHFP